MDKIFFISVKRAFTGGIPAEELFKNYMLFGDDPYIVPDEGAVPFSSSEYAVMRSRAICGRMTDRSAARETAHRVQEQRTYI